MNVNHDICWAFDVYGFGIFLVSGVPSIERSIFLWRNYITCKSWRVEIDHGNFLWGPFSHVADLLINRRNVWWGLKDYVLNVMAWFQSVSFVSACYNDDWWQNVTKLQAYPWATLWKGALIRLIILVPFYILFFPSIWWLISESVGCL